MKCELQFKINFNLTQKASSKIVADDKLKFFFFYFSEKIRHGISCESSAKVHSQEMPSLICFEKLKKKKKEKSCPLH